jgi:hypothetical protein
MSLIHLATHGTNENTRLNAGKYVVDRVLGRIGDEVTGSASPLEKLLGDFHKELEQHANEGKG